MRLKNALYALAALAAIASAQADSTQGITDTTIKIGNLGPFSGPQSVFTPLNYGPEAYLRYINAQGGVNGRKFVTVFADDSCNEAKGIAAAKKLIFEDRVFMIMSNPCSGVAMAIKPMLEAEGVPWIGASANPKITRPTVPNMFHTTYTGVESGRAMARFAMSKPGATRMALAMHSDDWAHGYCDNATDYIKNHGGQVVANEIAVIPQGVESDAKKVNSDLDDGIKKNLDAALARIEDGSYGFCEETGEPIGLKRLDARPIATLSLEAQERHERRERVFRED